MMPEVFVDYEFDGMLYKVGNFGTIIGKRGVLKQRLNYDGYPEVTLGREKGKRTSVRVHRIVAKLFVPNPNNLPEVNHIDCNRQNSRFDNLEWCTHQENIEHSMKLGNYKGRYVGEKNPRVTFTTEQVLYIRDLYDNGVQARDIILDIYGMWKDRNQYKSWHGNIMDICKRRTWLHI